MIPRTVLSSVIESISIKPVTLITGARQVGKTTLCKTIAEEHGYNYVSLADRREREMASNDPDYFLSVHQAPLIIDEAQYAPELFDSIESAVDKRKYETGSNEGMYILTGSQSYHMMENITQSLAGRVSIITMSPLSQNEILNREEIPFKVDPVSAYGRSQKDDFNIFKKAVRGFYPELYDKPEEKSSEFYSDYVDTYITRDVSELINLKDKDKFMRLLEISASLTGQELVYSTISNAVGVDIKTVKSWLEVLVSGNIIRLIQPYYENSAVKRVVKHPKLYFCDTGLACYLARITDAETLRTSYLGGHMAETFIVNEIIKTYTNNRIPAGFYYYRDSNNNEIDLVILSNGELTLIECKSGIRYGKEDIKAFKVLKSNYVIGPSCLICSTDTPYPISDGTYAIPASSI